MGRLYFILRARIRLFVTGQREPVARRYYVYHFLFSHASVVLDVPKSSGKNAKNVSSYELV